ncbi:MAG: hypothetical protein OXE75_00265 [bacterium]|nr:hypothetical protein [bacterium]
MVDVLVVKGWSLAATAERFEVDAKTARKWRDAPSVSHGGGVAVSVPGGHRLRGFPDELFADVTSGRGRRSQPIGVHTKVRDTSCT